MKNKRRDFLKLSGLAGIGMANLGILQGFTTKSNDHNGSDIEQTIKYYEKSHVQQLIGV